MSDKQTQKNDIAQLIQLGREQGYLTHADMTAVVWKIFVHSTLAKNYQSNLVSIYQIKS